MFILDSRLEDNFNETTHDVYCHCHVDGGRYRGTPSLCFMEELKKHGSTHCAVYTCASVFVVCTSVRMCVFYALECLCLHVYVCLCVRVSVCVYLCMSVCVFESRVLYICVTFCVSVGCVRVRIYV